MTPDEIERFVRDHRIRFVKKADSALMRLLARPLRVLGNREFLDRYWTTIGRTVYLPDRVNDPYDDPLTLEHEFIHVRQWERGWILFSISYLLLPVPFGLAWFRWRFEREAYLVQLSPRPTEEEIDRIVRSLWTGYGWPWPRRWMKRWFMRAIARL